MSLADRIVCVSALSKDLEGALDLVHSERERLPDPPLRDAGDPAPSQALRRRPRLRLQGGRPARRGCRLRRSRAQVRRCRRQPARGARGPVPLERIRRDRGDRHAARRHQRRDASRAGVRRLPEVRGHRRHGRSPGRHDPPGARPPARRLCDPGRLPVAVRRLQRGRLGRRARHAGRRDRLRLQRPAHAHLHRARRAADRRRPEPAGRAGRLLRGARPHRRAAAGTEIETQGAFTGLDIGWSVGIKLPSPAPPSRRRSSTSPSP